MMKTTPWKEYTEGDHRYRIRATYGIDYEFGRRHNQAPHFSVTGEIERQDDRRPHHWREDGGGMLHDDIARHFPQLGPYLKWHLVAIGDGPLHYIANAKYWYEKLTGTSRWQDQPGDPDPREAFKSTVVLGGLYDDPADVPRAPWPQVQAWLRDRLPKLMGSFSADMGKLGVLE